MSSLRSQKIEVSAAFVIALSSVAAGLLGLYLGRAGAIGNRRAPTRPAGSEYPPGDRHVGPEWRSVSELEDRLRTRDTALEKLRRDYKLDTGLLKEEVRRLKENLVDLAGPPAHDRTLPATPIVAHRPRSKDVLHSSSRPMQFSSLEDLAGRSPDVGS